MIQKRASSIGGSRIVSGGSIAYAVRTAVNGGLELVIFVSRAAQMHDLSAVVPGPCGVTEEMDSCRQVPRRRPQNFGDIPSAQKGVPSCLLYTSDAADE